MKNNVSTKRNSSKKKNKNKVTFKEYLRRKAKDIWYDREAIIFCVGVIAVFGFLYFMTHYNPNNDSEICTIESVEIIEHEDPYAISGVFETEERGGTVSGMNDIRPKGFFETEECGTLTLYEAPEGWKVPAYVATAQPGKKYLFHVANSSPKKERDFDTTRFEEIKE